MPSHKKSFTLRAFARVFAVATAVTAVTAVVAIGVYSAGVPQAAFSAPGTAGAQVMPTEAPTAEAVSETTTPAADVSDVPIEPEAAPVETVVPEPTAPEEPIVEAEPNAEDANAPSAARATADTFAAAAAGTGVLTITMEPVDVLTGAPQTWAGMSAFNVSTKLGYRISYSCSVSDCLAADIQVTPGPTDPTYGFYRHMIFENWTAPFIGATIGGNDTTGRLVSLGDLVAGASGSFVINYNWSALGNANAATLQPAQFFPNGFPIVMAATASSTSISNAPAATAAPVEWRSTIRDPFLGQANPGTRDAGADFTYTVTMNSGCLPTRDTAAKGDSRFTCAKSYTVVDQLDARATFVSATGGGVYDSGTHTVTWTRTPATGLGEPAAGWYAVGSSSINTPRTVTVNYPAAAFSPSGTAADYCDFTASVTNQVTLNMVYLGAGGMADNSNTRTLTAPVSHDIVCVSPFAKAAFLSKLSTFDGPVRYGNGSSPIVVQPAPNLNEHRWDLTVANQSNVPGVAVISEPALAIEGTQPSQITALNSANVQQDDATIAWTLNTGVTGSAMGVAIAPAGTWFTAMTVTSGPLAGPNLQPTGTAQTVFVVRINYDVTATAPVNQTRTNTASAQMTFPGYPTLATMDLGTQTHTLAYLAPFGRATLAKDTSNSGTAGQIVIPPTGSVNATWSVIARNTGNIPGVAVIEDLNLGGRPVQVRTVTAFTSGNNTLDGASLSYTLNTGVTGTATLPFTAPVGTWLTAVTATSSVIEPVNALSTQSANNSYFEIRLGYSVPSTLTPGSTWTNTATSTMTYPGMGVASVVTPPATRTVTYGAAATVITASFAGAPVVQGGGSAVPGRDVTFAIRGTSSAVPTGAAFNPQYAFIAPANWAIVAGSAAFADPTIPAGVSFVYTSVVIGGVTRDAVVATWPTGTTFGANVTWPDMSVVAEPTATAVAGSNAVATAWVGEADNNWTTTQVTFTGAVTDTIDIDADGSVLEGFSTANATAVVVGSAAQLSVVKEICSPDASLPGGCEWLSDSTTPVGVDPNATNITYRLTVTNAGNTTLSNVVGYDVLPHLNDFGTSDDTVGNPRGSTFQETVSSVTGISAGMTVTYSADANPPRPEVYSGSTSGNWAAPAAGAQALRLSYPGALAPGASLTMMYAATVVGNPSNGAKACNSLAVRVTGIGTVSEPAPVCAIIEESDLSIALPATADLQIGRPAVITLTAENVSGAPNSTATVTIDIPAGLTVTDFSPAGWTCVPTPNGTAPLIGPATLDCTPTTELAHGVGVPLPLEVIPTAASVCLDASIVGPSFDTNGANDNANQCFTTAASASGLDVVKTDGTATARVGDTLTYDITVTNELVYEAVDGATLVDELPAGLSFVSATNGGTLAASDVTWDLGTLAPDSMTTVSVTVVVTELVANQFVNRATITAVDPGFPAVTMSDEATDTDMTARLTLEKSGSSAQAVPVPGDLVNYDFVITNVGGATLTSVNVADGLAGLSTVTYSNWPDAPGVLAPGASVTATATYPLTAANIDAGFVTNNATAGGRTVDTTLVTATDTVDVPLTRQPRITLDKTAVAAGSAAGDLITYTFVITNDGNVTLTGVAVADALAGLSTLTYGAWPAAAGVLRAGQSVTATATYPVTQADVDNGSLANTATASATSVAGAPTAATDSATVTFDEDASLSLDKSAALLGSTITYTFSATNTGNVTLTGVTIDDALAGLSPLVYTWPTADGVLAPGQTVTATATYTVTQSDLDAGSVNNSATVSGITPSDETVDATDTETVPLIASPSMTFDKSVTGSAGLGSVLTYQFELVNTGNVTLDAVGVADGLIGLSALTYAWPGTAGTLTPGQTVIASATYTVTQADIDRGSIVNTATGTATPPTGAAITDDDTVTVTISQNPAIELDKTVDVAAGDTGIAGDVLTYTFVVENTGDVTLTAVRLADELEGLSAIDFTWPGTSGILVPGAIATATATYTITQADVDAGFVTNNATATGDFDGEDITDEDTVTVETPLDSSLTFSKTVEGSSTGPAQAGDVIHYAFALTNTGVVTLDGVTIVDPMPGLSIIASVWPGASGTLAPGQFVTATASYVLTQKDIDAGAVINTATGSGTTPLDLLVTLDDTATLPLEQAPSATLEKTAVVAFDERWQVGDVATFSFEVVNTGNVTLTEAVIADPMVGLSTVEYSWPGADGELAPGATLTATAEYALDSADIAAESLTNHASLRALTGTLFEVTDEAAVTLDAPPEPSAGNGLAFTGFDITGPGIGGTLLLGVGILFVVLAERRRREGRGA